jgi:hypothetical protein
MQIVKYTGWEYKYIINTFSLDEISKLAKWAFNQEVVERENLYAIMSWHVAIQNKKSAGRAKKVLKKNLTRSQYNDVDEQDMSRSWMEAMRQWNPNAFDNHLKNLQPQ